MVEMPVGGKQASAVDAAIARQGCCPTSRFFNDDLQGSHIPWMNSRIDIEFRCAPMFDGTLGSRKGDGELEERATKKSGRAGTGWCIRVLIREAEMEIPV